MKLKLNLLLIFSFVAIFGTHGQELDSVVITLENDMVVVRYDFLDGEPGHVYELYLFSSHDNFQKPLQLTTGDIGKGIQIGAGKIIYWNAKQELGNFKGDISLKIKGDIYTPMIRYLNVYDNMKLKQGSIFDLQWKSNDKSDKVLLKIQRHGVPVTDPLVVDNNGSFSWIIPKDVKAGKGYSVQIADTNNLLREETSNTFSIKRKVSLGYKVIPPILVAGGVAAIFLLKSDPEGEIPEPPLTPAGN
jgi:hypothetical protein